jgi:hypothetical protein
MNRRAALALLYGMTLFGVLALDNLVDVPDVLKIVVWLLAPAAGFLVGRWWVALALLGILGRVVGWDPAENDGNPALWPPYIVFSLALFGLPLLAGVAAAKAREARAL